MNRFSPKKLLNSKWTAVRPVNKEKHFIVVEVEFDELGNVELCTIQAAMTKRSFDIDWRSLKCREDWLVGWQ